MVQMILSSDGEKSYTVFLYPESGIKWVRGQGKNRNQLDPQAQAGFMSGEGQSFLLPPSGLDQIVNIDKWSNTDVPGLWIYKVGPLDHLGNVEGPEIGVRKVADPTDASSCQEGKGVCHSQAECSDNQFGFCCTCNPGWYGDGQNCLAEALPQRVNGRVNGELNGVSIAAQDLHCYVVTEDGRTYTAISRIPDHLGWAMQGLIPIGTVISWLFAFPGTGGKNGFGLTGGVLNYTAEVYYPDTGEQATLVFQFNGMDVFDYLKADVTISGTVPMIPQGAKIKVEDNFQEFSRAGPGFISARSNNQFTVEGTDKVVPFTVEQSIRWNECSGEMEHASMTMRLESTRNFIIYDNDEQIVRYAMTSNISPLSGDDNPCSAADCGANGLCLVEGDSFRCRCMPGFVSSGEEFSCEDLDECSSGENDCHEDAECSNAPGSFSCTCRSGYMGDGRQCMEERSCEDLACSENAECVLNKFGQGQCICRTGFQGDGSQCTVIPSDVSIRGYANPDMAILDPWAATDVSLFSDLGPQVNHYYEVSNFGPFDVGSVIVNISWPLQSADGDWILYLVEKPFVKYNSAGREMQDECEIDHKLVNSLNLGLDRRTRQSRDYDLGTGAIFDTYGNREEEDEYDYSHLVDNLIDSREVEEMEGRTPILEPISAKDLDVMKAAMPDSERVMQKPIIAPSYDGEKFGRVSFLCRVNLAVNEIGVVHIISRLHQQSLTSKYEGVAKFSIESNAEMLENGFVRARDNSSVAAKTTFEVRDPAMKQGPGQGVLCGGTECHKYASCIMVFGPADGATCTCPEGFDGDGVSLCEPAAPVETRDCRTGAPCGHNAECTYQSDRASFACMCEAGYQGDGRTCNLVENANGYPAWNTNEISPTHGYPTEQTTIRNSWSEEEDNYYPAYVPPSQEQTTSRQITQSWLRPFIATQRPNVNGANAPRCLFGVCTCPNDLDFDGTNCVEKVMPRGQCRNKDDCDPKAGCEYDEYEQVYKCKCMKSYEGDGLMCRPGPDAGCDILENCHSNAKCHLNEAAGQHYCRCDTGYMGDGFKCEKEPQIGCNVINNCGKFSECIFDRYDRGYKCVCDAVRGFVGDGYTCTPGVSCFENPAICDPNADCIPTPDHSSTCRCKQMFLGDGFECEPAPRFEGNFMLLAQGMMLFKVPFSGKGSKPINVLSSQVASGIDIDCMKGQVYWSDTTNKLIKRANMDGKNVETFMSESMKFPEGLAIDWVSRNVYWTDPGKDTIEVASMEDSTRYTLLEAKLESPRGIAVHPGIGRMFWTDWDRYGPKIEAANMDGTGRQTLVNSGLGEPNSLSVDFYNYDVCWADAGSKRDGIKPRIDCIGVNGAGRRTVVELTEGDFPYGITITENSILWTDWNRKLVQRADKQTGVRQPAVNYALAHIGKPYDLVNVPEECPNISNTCQGQPCGRGRLCLPDGSGSHICK
eukprot:GFUD01000718.1.p1 GENE.GFUD01000718.1~~GFUD01000718.1.p1  ORF type:complete len:1537 (-),score=283.11 GFUD01000718.1:154-4470(-)